MPIYRKNDRNLYGTLVTYSLSFAHINDVIIHLSPFPEFAKGNLVLAGVTGGDMDSYNREYESMRAIFEAYIPVLLAGGAVISFVLLLVRMGRFWRKKRRRKEQPVISNSFAIPKLGIANPAIHQNGHSQSVQLNMFSTPFAVSQLNQIMQASFEGQFRLLSSLSAEQRRQFVNGLSFEGQAALWSSLPLEIWASWVVKSTHLLPYEQEELRQLLVFCSRHFREWSLQWDQLGSQQQAHLWTKLDMGQQEMLWQRLIRLQRVRQEQSKKRQAQLDGWEQMVPAEQVNLWLALDECERLMLWQRYPLAYWTQTWLALNADLRTQLWSNLNSAQRKRLRYYWEQLPSDNGGAAMLQNGSHHMRR